MKDTVEWEFTDDGIELLAVCDDLAVLVVKHLVRVYKPSTSALVVRTVFSHVLDAGTT